MIARNVNARVVYNNTDISTDIVKHIKSINFRDALDAEADSISISLEDRNELWESDWMPSKGAKLDVSLMFENWNSEGFYEYHVGIFEIDELSISGLPHEVSLNAVSVPANNNLRGICKNKAWENVKLIEIVQEKANEAGLELFFDVKDDKEIKRIEQKEESDLAFLTKILKERSCGIKVSDNQLVVYYVPDLDKKGPEYFIDKYSSNLSSYSFKTKTRDVYKTAHVRYENTQTGELIEYTFSDDSKADGQTLEVHKQVDNIAEAEELAKAELRNKNKDEVTGSLKFGGIPKGIETVFVSGMVIEITGFHSFDGKYIITNSSHSVGNAYQCSIDIRRCLNGY